MSGDLIDTTEMYLKTVYELREMGIAPMRARIAERLGHSGPTVSQTVARMERDGLLRLGSGRVIELTDEGRRTATAVMRKHRLAERHLLDVIGLDIAQVHDEACRWEHVMSREVEKRIAAALAPPYLDPFGNPIPGLRELGVDPQVAEASMGSDTPTDPGDSTGEDRSTGGDRPTGEGADPGGAAHAIASTARESRPYLETGVTPLGKASASDMRPLTRALHDDGPVDLVLARIGEWAQADRELLDDIARQGILPGTHIQARRIADAIVLETASGNSLALDDVAAGQFLVTAPADE
ncbi:metal-dependent transcriptional regulator [Brachybacterium timonense]|uniref:metal-dependent transcriptional regulator n=1 Tax=Brachybacterium timonense TaxID=2050896 RepID=UPI000D0B898E